MYRGDTGVVRFARHRYALCVQGVVCTYFELLAQATVLRITKSRCHALGIANERGESSMYDQKAGSLVRLLMKERQARDSSLSLGRYLPYKYIPYCTFLPV